MTLPAHSSDKPAAGVPAAGVPAAGVPAAGVPAAGVPAADGERSREWTPGRLLRITLALLALVVVIAACGSLPVEGGRFSSGAVGLFLLIWGVGGLLTITLLAASDRRG